MAMVADRKLGLILLDPCITLQLPFCLFSSCLSNESVLSLQGKRLAGWLDFSEFRFDNETFPFNCCIYLSQLFLYLKHISLLFFSCSSLVGCVGCSGSVNRCLLSLLQLTPQP